MGRLLPPAALPVGAKKAKLVATLILYSPSAIRRGDLPRAQAIPHKVGRLTKFVSGNEPGLDQGQFATKTPGLGSSQILSQIPSWAACLPLGVRNWTPAPRRSHPMNPNYLLLPVRHSPLFELQIRSSHSRTSTALRLFVQPGFQKECLEDKIRAHACVSRRTLPENARTTKPNPAALARF